MIIATNSVLSADYEPLFNEDVVKVHVTAGLTAKLPCSAVHKGVHRIIWMNPKRILFSNEEKIVIDDNRVHVQSSLDGDWNLHIEHVRYNDSGEYTCQINTSPVKIKRVFLYVQVPSFILNKDSSRDIDVEEGKDVSLTCKVTGVPFPNVTWFRMSIVASENKEYLDVEGETLFISNIRRYQGGKYACLAYNGVPPAVTREIEVKVQYPPLVKLTNTKLGQRIGKETILECKVTSYPRAKITWIKNGVAIEHSYKYRLELYSGLMDSYTLTLQIQYLNKNDYGDYTCEAENRMGIERATMLLYEYKESSTKSDFIAAYIPSTTAYDLIENNYDWTGTDVKHVSDNEHVEQSDDNGHALSNVHKEKYDNVRFYKHTHTNSATFQQTAIVYQASILTALCILAS